MVTMEGTFRIVNIKYHQAITIPGYHTGAVVGWRQPHQPNQQWFIRRAGDKFHIEDCLYGRYLVPEYTGRGARVNLGRYPANWEILSVGENKYIFKVAGHDLLLDLHGPEDGAEIHVWQRNITEPQKIWKLDKLSDFAGNAPEAFSAASKDTLIGRLTEQLEEKDSQLTEQEERIDNQAQEIQQLKTEITEKDQQLKELNQAINKLLVRMADGNADILTDLQTNSAGNVESEISSLREQVSRMESVLSQWKGIGDIHEMPNNISSEA
ncbi:FIP domain protein [Rhizoctonia solani AG-3 Rhs1AP]|uniref:FIP domain protein n=2 Tax=Rhizoctonia solani AG-3 TaxID=1086053 RepID=A0A074RZV9_9AGAM|nr:FIP domain protein [Rhizoctonia solani AG-3 Rhs1AP]KEP50825.1 FIP domain protein [Rhizoctonia solani 123E]